MQPGRPRKRAAGAAAIVLATPRSRVNNRPEVPFYKFNQWLLSLFNVTHFEELAH